MLIIFRVATTYTHCNKSFATPACQNGVTTMHVCIIEYAYRFSLLHKVLSNSILVTMLREREGGEGREMRKACMCGEGR